MDVKDTVKNLKKIVKALTGQCKHPREERARGQEYDFCADCGMELDEKTVDETPCIENSKSGHNLDTRRRLLCLACGGILPEPTATFRKFIALRKHIRFRVGYPTDRQGERLSDTPTFNVGLRYVIPDNPMAVRRVWVTFNDKKSQKSFAAQVERRMRFCSDDEGYNEVINEAIDIIREVNPDIEEQVVERGDSEPD